MCFVPNICEQQLWIPSKIFNVLRLLLIACFGITATCQTHKQSLKEINPLPDSFQSKTNCLKLWWCCYWYIFYPKFKVTKLHFRFHGTANKHSVTLLGCCLQERADAVKTAACFDFLIGSRNQCHITCNYGPLILNDNANMFALVSKMTYMLWFLMKRLSVVLGK